MPAFWVYMDHQPTPKRQNTTLGEIPFCSPKKQCFQAIFNNFWIYGLRILNFSRPFSFMGGFLKTDFDTFSYM